ncbi:hypothetical protein O1611_g5051 [Lasiodiplodia mahajangana]|uniref:Uncharacterized protein n=1 Tax=Lasiodiplodia mahajangana TaxID=1108764 RepID=A0ACC2JM45_9PEZI|nr:hypothetical protein O1611_g5051 [Lasiodiplodia mahajangana]
MKHTVATEFLAQYFLPIRRKHHRQGSSHALRHQLDLCKTDSNDEVGNTSLRALPIEDCGVDGGTIVVANPNYQILDELEACSTIFGDILIDPGFVYFTLQGPQEITGTIIAHDNVILKTLSLTDAHKLGGLSYANPDIATVISFPELIEIGNLEWRNITWEYDFDYFSWEAEKFATVSNLNVEGTYLSGFKPDYPSYDGVSFYYGGLGQLETAGNIRVVNNLRMDEVVFESLKTISGSLVVGSNFNFLNSMGKRDSNPLLVSLPALESIGNVIIYDVEVIRGNKDGKIDLPVLGHVFGDFNVTTIGGLSEISVPTLTDIDGGLYILGNDALKNLDFPELRRVNHVFIDGGDAYYGGFETISFSALEEVGAFHVRAPAYVFDCSSLEHIRQIATEFSCENSEGTYDPDTPSSTIEVPTPTPTPSDPAPSPTGEPSPSNEPSSSLTNEPSLTSEPMTTDEPNITSEPSLTSEPATTGELNVTSDPVATGQPNQPNVPVPTGSAEPPSNPDTTGGAGATPTNEAPADTSESAPASSGASGLKSPFVTFLLLFTYWLL